MRTDFEPAGSPATGEDPPSRRRQTSAGASVPELLRGLVSDGGQLMTQEIALAKSELAQALRSMRAGLVSIAIAGVTLAAGAMFLLLAAVYALSTRVEPWMAALIVGGTVTLVGIVMLMRARSRLSGEALILERTLKSLRKDERMVRDAVT